ncbi:unnamed protein product [Discula destructiva]
MPCVLLQHPGYGSGADNILLDLPAVDGSGSMRGLHHGTILSAGAIIADNAFDHVYLTRDRAGLDRVDATVPRDGLVEPGEYWLQREGYELHRNGNRNENTAVDPSMAPPSSRTTSTASNATQSSTPSTDAARQKTGAYPIVPSFGDWRFPHDRLPPEWQRPHVAPPTAAPANSTPSRRCWITGYQLGINECHMVPKNQELWWETNRMRRYTNRTAASSRDEANIALLRADIHEVLDSHKLVIIPKPSTSSGASFAFAAHVLETDHEARELYALYHNIAIAQAGVDRLSPEFLFARFAWAIFAHLQTFLGSSTRRHLAVIVPNEADVGSYSTVWRYLNGTELTTYAATRGVTRSGFKIRKRSSSQMTQDWIDAEDDAYRERWERRSRSLDSVDTSSDGSDDLDPEIKQIRKNTRHYEKVGRFSRVNLEQEQIEWNTRHYEAERLSRATDDMDSESSGEHGHLGRPDLYGLASWPPGLGSDGMPNLSSSFNTHSSNLSSILDEGREGECEAKFFDASGAKDQGFQTADDEEFGPRDPVPC